MESVERIEQRVRVRYEVGRLRRALAGFAPVLILVAIAALVAKRPSVTLGFGVAVFAVGSVLLWYGRDVRRAVLPGLAAGIVPLVLTLCANHVGHACMDDRCLTLCIPVCAAGGVIAGLLVVIVGLRRRGRPAFWIAASGLALLTGAMGCGCVGYAGLAGLAIGFAGGLTSGLVGRRLRKP
jgi:hypothetical protein